MKQHNRIPAAVPQEICGRTEAANAAAVADWWETARATRIISANVPSGWRASTARSGTKYPRGRYGTPRDVLCP